LHSTSGTGSDVAAAQADPASFRDRGNQVRTSPAGVFRLLSAEALEDWRRLSATSLFQRNTLQGRIARTDELGGESWRGWPGGERWAGCLRHERIPFVSYPYEWSFLMLKEAALLHLDLLAQGIEEGLTLKDATPYNVQWKGAAPVFIDKCLCL